MSSSALPKAPRVLYKYRPFNARTLRLLSDGEAYYADPATFNDPLDCQPVITVDTDVGALEKLCYRMLVLALDKDKALKRIDEYRHLSEEYGNYQSDVAATDAYVESLRACVERLLYSKMKTAGVLSLAGRWNCPLMWSHYADQHRGLCVAYSTSEHRCGNLAPVDYRSPGDMKVSVLGKWIVDKSTEARDSIRAAFFYAKAGQWRYEKEWRDVKWSAGVTYSPLKPIGVYFGLRCDDAVRTAVVKLFINSSGCFFTTYSVRTTVFV